MKRTLLAVVFAVGLLAGCSSAPPEPLSSRECAELERDFNIVGQARNWYFHISPGEDRDRLLRRVENAIALVQRAIDGGCQQFDPFTHHTDGLPGNLAELKHLKGSIESGRY